jgi:hypothetical protein
MKRELRLWQRKWGFSMTKYNFQKIDELLQPLMTMMQNEFPNNCKLIIEPHFAKIIYEHDEMIFKSDEIKKLTK